MDFERGLVHLITCTWHDESLGRVLEAAQNKVLPVVLVGVVLAVIAWSSRRLAIRALLTAAAAWGLAMLVADVMWHTIDRQRPTQAYEVVLRTPEELATCASHPEALALRGTGSTSRSFPSRHALTAGAFTAALWFARRWAGLLALAYSLVMAWGRIYVGKHWPTDLLAGGLLGALLAWGVWRLLPRIFTRLADPPAPASDAGSVRG
jgi:membrane-associated phospholipid phosphatase